MARRFIDELTFHLVTPLHCSTGEVYHCSCLILTALFRFLPQAIKSHRVKQDSKTFRERTVLVFGDEKGASDMYFDLAAKIRKLEYGEDIDDEVPGAAGSKPASTTSSGGGQASKRWADAIELLKFLNLEQYTDAFVEEEMTSIQLLEEIVGRTDGEKELMEALKEMGVKKMGHRQSIVGAIVGRI